MKLDYSERSVVVTGGTGGLGRAVVRRLIEAGARCIVPVFDRSETEGEALWDHERVELRADVDLTDPSQAENLFKAVRGPLWASIHCAGGFDMAPIEDADADAFDKMMNMNARTCYLCCRGAVLAMKKRGEGRIVNVAARPALFPELGAGLVAYTASKAAVAATTQALAAELADTGIWVNAVVPSIIDTPSNRAAMPDADHDTWAKVEDIADVIAFLASPVNKVTRAALVPVYGRHRG